MINIIQDLSVKKLYSESDNFQNHNSSEKTNGNIPSNINVFIHSPITTRSLLVTTKKFLLF